MKCTHEDCITCPYPDCISSSGPVNRVKKKPGRKRLSPEEKRARRKARDHRYYEKHKEKFSAYYKEYNKKNSERIKEKQRTQRDAYRRLRSKPIGIWVTDGVNNKRTLLSELPQYEAMGWHRGRTIVRRNKDGILG